MASDSEDDVYDDIEFDGASDADEDLEDDILGAFNDDLTAAVAEASEEVSQFYIVSCLL